MSDVMGYLTRLIERNYQTIKDGKNVFFGGYEMEMRGGVFYFFKIRPSTVFPWNRELKRVNFCQIYLEHDTLNISAKNGGIFINHTPLLIKDSEKYQILDAFKSIYKGRFTQISYGTLQNDYKNL